MLSLLIRASLEGAVLAAAVWLVCRALPRMSPGVRALLWWCVAAKFVVALLWPAPIRLAVLPAPTVNVPAATVATHAVPPAFTASAGRANTAPVPAPRAPEIPWTAVVVGAWTVGMGIALARTLRDWRCTRALVSRSLPAPGPLHADVRDLSLRLASRAVVDVRMSPEVESPLIVGVRRPVILVPATGFAALSPDQRRMALCHEIAHLKRGDLWLGCVPAAAERFFFFHPLARLAAREYAFWREAACDEAVLTTLGTSPQSYGRMLLALGVSRRTATFSAAGAAWSFHNLKRRITMLDHTSSSSFRGRALAACAVAAALVAVVPIRAVARSVSSPASIRSLVAAPRQAPHVAAIPASAPAVTPTVTPAAPEQAANAAVARQDEVEFVLFHADGNTMTVGNSSQADRARRLRRGNEPLLWFRYAGGEYVVRDAGVLREVSELWEPVSRIGEEQGHLGQQQGAIGAHQGRIGAQQAEVGARQGALGQRMGVIGARLAQLAMREASGVTDADRRAIARDRRELEEQASELNRQMEQLNRDMAEFEGPMHERDAEMEELGAQMEVLGGQMEEATGRAENGMQTLVRRAIQSGAAVPVR